MTPVEVSEALWEVLTETYGPLDLFFPAVEHWPLIGDNCVPENVWLKVILGILFVREISAIFILIYGLLLLISLPIYYIIVGLILFFLMPFVLCEFCCQNILAERRARQKIQAIRIARAVREEEEKKANEVKWKWHEVNYKRSMPIKDFFEKMSLEELNRFPSKMIKEFLKTRCKQLWISFAGDLEKHLSVNVGMHANRYLADEDGIPTMKAIKAMAKNELNPPHYVTPDFTFSAQDNIKDFMQNFARAIDVHVHFVEYQIPRLIENDVKTVEDLCNKVFSDTEEAAKLLQRVFPEIEAAKIRIYLQRKSLIPGEEEKDHKQPDDHNQLDDHKEGDLDILHPE
mmetsp:Transcript_13950/g.21091  ORF Transcript_13950/g.21091 Transcript_13950/m.21091 type:complete len:343 (+) Transcript_13950:49-1077(+)